MVPRNPAEWQTFKDNNLIAAPVESAEDRSLHWTVQIIEYAERWADLMEAAVAAGSTVADCAEGTSFDADNKDANGVTLFMYQSAIRALVQFWQHGEALRTWHNARFQNPGEQKEHEGWLMDCASMKTPLGKAMIVALYSDVLSGGIATYQKYRLKAAAAIMYAQMEKFYAKYVTGTTAPVHNMCPNCKAMVDAYTSDGERTPRPGDTTICVYCAAILRFDKKMNNVLLTTTDLEGLKDQDAEHFLNLSAAWWDVKTRLTTKRQ